MVNWSHHVRCMSYKTTGDYILTVDDCTLMVGGNILT
jgi:hypothetical protein